MSNLSRYKTENAQLNRSESLLLYYFGGLTASFFILTWGGVILINEPAPGENFYGFSLSLTIFLSCTTWVVCSMAGMPQAKLRDCFSSRGAGHLGPAILLSPLVWVVTEFLVAPVINSLPFEAPVFSREMVVKTAWPVRGKRHPRTVVFLESASDAKVFTGKYDLGCCGETIPKSGTIFLVTYKKGLLGAEQILSLKEIPGG